jgi:hypothetical protein
MAEIFVEASCIEKEMLEALNFRKVDLDFIRVEIREAGPPQNGSTLMSCRSQRFWRYMVPRTDIPEIETTYESEIADRARLEKFRDPKMKRAYKRKFEESLNRK